MNEIIALDWDVTLWVNSLNNEFFDQFFYWVSNKWVWVPFYILILFLSYKKGGKQFFFLVVAHVALLILLADQTASGIFKHTFERFRPTHEPAIMNMVHIVNGYRGGLYGFCSSHASNFFAIATFFSLIFRQRLFWILSFFFALLTIYSRVYLGVHYVGDVLVGAIIGSIYGILVFKLLSYCSKKFLKEKNVL